MSEIEFPEKIDNEDIDLIFKEWRLAGVDCVFTGEYGVIFETNERMDRYCKPVYRREGGVWKQIPLEELDDMCAAFPPMGKCPLGVAEYCFREDRG